MGLNNLLNILQLLNGSEFLKVFETKQIHTQVLVLYNSFLSGWDLGLILFSIHLIILGFIMIRANYIPKIFGILITISGFGYLIDGIGKILISDYTYEVALFTFAGEVLLIFLLFWKGIKGFKIHK